MKELYNFFLFLFVILLIILLFRNLNFREGMTDASGNPVNTPTTNITNGIAGNASSFGASIKTATIKLQDTFLISKYKNDYETIILNMDDLLNNLMLKSVLTFKQDNVNQTIKNLIDLNQAKQSLNNVMKFIDSN